MNALSETDLIVLSGVGTHEGRQFEVRGDTRDDIGEFRTFCQDHGIPIDITAVHALLPVQEEGHELTDTQQEALVLTHERGYFDSPRAVSLAEVAKELGVTQRPLSSRLRRGYRRLIAATLIHE